MKKHLFFIACLLATGIYAGAQKADTAGTVVHYKFSHLRDTTKPQEMYAENMMLMIGKNCTAYKSYDRRLADADIRRQVQQQMANGNGRIMIKSKSASSNTEYYLYPNENKLVRKEKLINSYLIEGPAPVINWKISADTASFAGLHCQKANTHFKGRDYTAWFCPDIAIHSGPWKLSGLPGLILEAYDTKKQVVFKFDGVEDVSKTAMPATTAPASQPQLPDGGKLFGFDDANKDPRLIELPADAIKTTDVEFAKLKEAMRKDPDAFMQAAMGGQGNQLITKGPKNEAHIKMGNIVENNPIELPEKK